MSVSPYPDRRPELIDAHFLYRFIPSYPSFYIPHIHLCIYIHFNAPSVSSHTQPPEKHDIGNIGNEPRELDLQLDLSGAKPVYLRS